MNFSYWETTYFLGQIDYLIVGAGLTGLQSATLIKEKNPKAKVVVVDRFGWSLGASTRNAGFACFANVSEILDDLKHDSPEAVYQLAAKRYRGLQKLREKYGDINIDYQEKGSVEVFTSKNKNDLYKCIDSIQSINSILYNETGLDRVFTYSSKSQLSNSIGTIHNQYEGQLNTGKLYATIYRYAELIGVRILGGIEVESWEKGNTITVSTKQGIEINANTLVLCTNAFSQKLSVEDVVPARGQVILTEQLDQLPCEGLHIFDSGFYYWRDIDNRILLGGARNSNIEAETTDKVELNPEIIEELKDFMFNQIFGNEVTIDTQWSGIMGMGKEKNKTPIIKELEPNVILAARLGGMGVALSALVAQEVVDLIEQKRADLSLPS